MLSHFRASRVAQRRWNVFYFGDGVYESFHSRPLKDTPEDSVLLIKRASRPPTVKFLLLPSTSPLTPVLNLTKVNKS